MRFSSERIINGHNWAGSREKHRGSEPTRVDKVRKGAKNTE